ncbi:hypothetical protein FLAPXU55_02115 [Flavobacterium panici]|uniref:Uncharacterized protein n=2 Tax=Flavobacterium panici TaxID=2654843 RepID=A0A9N8P1T7_9FLAO|nr:hypothetical protein FLAPXU55_02115 [Flavobacterium panici]
MIMLSNISWSNYAIAVIILLFLWYVFVLLKFYFGSLKELLHGKRKFRVFRTGTKKNSTESSDLFSEFREPFDTLEDGKELFSKLQSAIIESSQTNLSAVEFRNYIRFILEAYPYVKRSSLREKINALMVSECEKHPQLILTYPEMDGLWDEAIS